MAITTGSFGDDSEERYNSNHDAKGQFASGGGISRVDAAAKMFGTGSKQYKAAVKKWGKGGGPKAQVVSVKSP